GIKAVRGLVVAGLHDADRFDRAVPPISHPAVTTVTVTVAMNSVASALICGLTPRRTLEKITMGSVVEDGPEVKLAITRSSSERVKASSQPASSAGAMSGRVM